MGELADVEARTQKPLVLYTNLPRVAEAVVKSLDPTISALRETVQQSATFILNELVRRCVPFSSSRTTPSLVLLTRSFPPSRSQLPLDRLPRQVAAPRRRHGRGRRHRV